MVRPRGEIKVICQNEKCKYYLKEEGKDIIKRGKYNSVNSGIKFPKFSGLIFPTPL